MNQLTTDLFGELVTILFGMLVTLGLASWAWALLRGATDL